MTKLICEVVAAYYLNKSRKKHIRANRRYWIHPLIEKRCLKGAFVSLYVDLRNNEENFFNYFRMSIRSFDELIGKIETQLQVSSFYRIPISPTERLAVTLRYFATGNTFTDLHYTYRLGISTISDIVRQVCHVIWNTLKTECMAQPTSEKWLEISEGFQNNANFPNCIGAVDGKHIRLIKPTKSGSSFMNYKNYFSIILLAICDSQYRFTFIDVGAYGKNADSPVFEHSAFWKKLQRNELNIPQPAPLPGTSEPSLPYALVADEAFALSKHVLKPYAKRNLNYDKKIFNYRLTRARRYIECSFGILSNKWRIFHRPLNVKLNLAVSIVKTCCILHNFVRDRDGYKSEETFTVVGFEEYEESTPSNTSRNSNRDELAKYFTTIGKVPWQDSKIY